MVGNDGDRAEPGVPSSEEPETEEAAARLAGSLPKAYVLAGFMREEDVSKLANLNEAQMASVRAKLGEGAKLAPVADGYAPSFRHVSEPEVLELLRSAAEAMPPALNNLVGFEWLDLEHILAGHLVTKPLVLTDRPLSSMSPIEVARFCMWSVPKPALQPVMRTDEKLVIHSLGHVTAYIKRVEQNEPFSISVEVGLGPAFAPIRVLVVHNRGVALAGLEKLVQLRAAGLKEALCLVSYGYGVSALQNLPTTSLELLAAERPPLIRDFVDENVSVEIRGPTQTTLLTLRPDTLVLGGP